MADLIDRQAASRIGERKQNMSKLTCTDCINTANFAGNYIECVLLHSFVDWFYWNNSAPSSCPLNGVADSDTQKTLEKEWRKEREVDEVD